MINWNFHCFLLFNNCASLRRAWLHLLCVFHQKENSKIPPWFYLCWSFLQETQLSWPLLLCCVLQLPDHLDGLQKTRVASLSWLTLKAGGSLFIFVSFLTAVPLYFIFTCLSLTVRFILSRQWGTCERTLCCWALYFHSTLMVSRTWWALLGNPRHTVHVSIFIQESKKLESPGKKKSKPTRTTTPHTHKKRKTNPTTNKRKPNQTKKKPTTHRQTKLQKTRTVTLTDGCFLSHAWGALLLCCQHLIFQ